MSNSELNGLRNIIGNTGTLHTLPESPARDDYPTDDAYAAAYNAWWFRTHCWKATTRPA